MSLIAEATASELVLRRVAKCQRIPYPLERFTAAGGDPCVAGSPSPAALDQCGRSRENYNNRRRLLSMKANATGPGHRVLLGSATALCLALGSGAALADMAAAEKWVDEEFQPSALSRDEQIAEMEWFVKASEPFAGMEVNVLSETIPTHSYESEVLTKAFEEITGIKVNHQLLGEGEVVQAVQTQMQTNRNLYDAYINDSDLIGTHSRLQLAVNLSDWMAGEGKDVTLPTLDVDDFIGREFTTGPDGKLYQLPDQQVANLYWFR